MKEMTFIENKTYNQVMSQALFLSTLEQGTKIRFVPVGMNDLVERTLYTFVNKTGKRIFSESETNDEFSNSYGAVSVAEGKWEILY